MRYLVTGGAGFIGSHLVDALARDGHHVVVLDDLSTGTYANIAHHEGSGEVDFVDGSILDRPLVDRWMERVDRCFHLASAVGVRLIVERPLETLLTNMRGNDNVISSAAHHRRRLLFTSTSEIYGKNSAGALHEDSDRVLGSAFASRWAYAIAKSLGEALAHAYTRDRGAGMVVARLFNTTGPRQSDAYGMVVPSFVRQALRGEDLTVYGDGTQSRCFVHVEDTVRALVALDGNDEALGLAFNVGSSNEVTIRELAERVRVLTGSASSIRLVPYTEAYGDGFVELGRRKPDTSAIRALTGWEPAWGLDEIITSVAEFERARIEPAAALLRSA